MSAKQAAVLALLVLAAALPLLRDYLRFPLEIQISGHLQVHRGEALPGVELWLPEPRLWIDQNRTVFQRDVNGELHSYREPDTEVESEVSSRGLLSVRVRTRCARKPRHCTVSVHQPGYVTRYAWQIPLEEKDGILVGTLPKMARLVPREPESEDPDPNP